MKTKIATLLLGIISSLSYGQITLVKTLEFNLDVFGEWFSSPTEISTREKWALIDYGKKEHYGSSPLPFSWTSSPKVVIYDNQFNELKSIVIDTTDIMDIENIYVSDKLYNTDDRIEVIYEYSKKTNAYSSGWEKGVIIIDEDNNLLHQESDTDTSFYYNEENNEYYTRDVKFYHLLIIGNSIYIVKKYIMQDRKNGTRTTEYKTFFYKLGGELPCRYTCGSSSTTNKKDDLPSYDVNIYPNPTSSSLNVEIPYNLSATKCEIYDGKGGFISSSFVNGGVNTVDVSLLANGTYVCKLYNEDQFVHSSVFIKK